MTHSPRHCKSPSPGQPYAAGIRPHPYHSLRVGDRANPRLDPLVLVDGYQPFKIGNASVIAVTAYPPPGTVPIAEPPLDYDDYLLCQFALAGSDDTTQGLFSLCDVSFELYPEVAHALAGRIDNGVARRMRKAEFIVVLDVPTSSDWTMGNVCLKLPNDQGMWKHIPEIG